MSVLETPTCYRYTPAWRAMMWRSAAFGVRAPLETWHPKERDGEWYTSRRHNDFGLSIWADPSGSSLSWRRGIWTGGQHEAEARIRHHKWLWSE